MENYGILDQTVPFPTGGRIACQGIRGANSQLAAERMFPHGQYMFFKTFEGVVEAVKTGMCDFGMLPIENNIHGSVRPVYNLLKKGEVTILRSQKLLIHHELLVKEGTNLEDVRLIYSHEQAIGQCSQFIKSLGDQVRAIPCENTAIAARMVAESEEKGVASLSSSACIDLYHLKRLDVNAQNSENNYTRFICISKNRQVYPGANRISLVLSLPHEPGSLFKILGQFAEINVDMQKLESVPIPGRDFEFMFYIDLMASVTNPDVVAVLEDLKNRCQDFVYLGNYIEN
ncbi:MAG: bifunctional chorismate mutase/prephenate dehydratase [Lachnospiraceae bacterium]|nr:bifunctional chorismate mutase/prephenate dehydratase [Candidatus Equihabitans merdae]